MTNLTSQGHQKLTVLLETDFEPTLEGEMDLGDDGDDDHPLSAARGLALCLVVVGRLEFDVVSAGLKGGDWEDLADCLPPVLATLPSWFSLSELPEGKRQRDKRKHQLITSAGAQEERHTTTQVCKRSTCSET